MMISYLKVFLLAALLILNIDSGWSQFRKCADERGYCQSVRAVCTEIGPRAECRSREKCCRGN
ncbi:uncharacterized protein LOC119551969 [Drosophila subpulchrella]|uniref:uncharacterized protein LOC119551969 n=1 Tax=Drosophila subpulchrella TaxID=1486046 RepID=UPI0018A1679D|nr:uncharacterized protein LOC119551969 [Drosophila subpulchrella]